MKTISSKGQNPKTTAPIKTMKAGKRPRGKHPSTLGSFIKRSLDQVAPKEWIPNSYLALLKQVKKTKQTYH